jgi:sensor histidine kinase YesM
MLKTKMFATFSIVSLFVVVLTCLIFYYKNVSDSKHQTLSLANTIARQFSRTVELYVQDIEKLSVSIFGDPIIQRSLLNHYQSRNDVEQNEIELTINNRLFTHLQPRPQLQSIYIFGLDDTAYYVSKANGPKVSFSLRNEAWYHDNPSIGKNTFFLLPTAEEATGRNHREQVISFVRNINRIPFREIIAYMKININVNVFAGMLVHSDSNEIERYMRVLIAADDGHIVYDNRNELTGRADTGLNTSIFAAPARTGDMRWNGTRYLYTFEKSDYTKWNTIILIPSDYLLSKQKKWTYILILIGLLSMLLIAVVSYLLSHHITLPLSYMMKKMSRVEQGDFSQRMEVKGNNEISRLSRIYNNMLDSISSLISDMYESKLAEKNAQLSALQAQINPHFLYNTLNIMKSISRVRGIEEVAEMSESLAELFQYSMNNLQHPVPLREELDHIGNYMNIQQHRFSDRFELCCDVPELLQDASVLKLTIQPLIENAIVHGLGKLRTGGVVRLEARRNGDLLIIEVTDNGQGMDEKRLQDLKRSLEVSDRLHELRGGDTHGIGLRNISQRIRLFYGEHAALTVISGPGQGTTVRLTIPYQIHINPEGEAKG